MWEYTQTLNSDELYHYGVVGMKWGVCRAARKYASNDRLARRSYKFDKKAAKMTKKSERLHAEYDLESKNKLAKKSAKYAIKSAKFMKKSVGQTDDNKRLRYERKAAKYAYKSAAKKIKADRISKTTGYGLKAMRYSIKSDKAKRKAEKARYKIAKNKYFINSMKRKVDSIPKDELKKSYAFVDQLKNMN